MLLDVATLEVLVGRSWCVRFLLWRLLRGRRGRLRLLRRPFDDLQTAISECVDARPRSVEKGENSFAFTFVARADGDIAWNAGTLNGLAFGHAEANAAGHNRGRCHIKLVGRS